ncbi:MAG: InlB B-repeat-containing protein [Treponema sp.]|nr:InlB B-repeat-containing protein [Treponema sp.]
MIRNLFLALILPVILLLTSCEFWQVPVRDYLEKWTSQVSIEKYELYGVETYTDKDGNLCIPSGQDVPVSLFMINPYHYDFRVFPGKITSVENESIGGNSFPTINPDAEDTTVLHFTYGSNYLTAYERGKDIGAIITVEHPYNSGEEKDFKFNLICNSRPPQPQDVTVMLSGNGEDATFILCFNLGAKGLFSSSGIHSDVKTISIDGDLYELNFASDGTVSVVPKTGGKLSTTSPSGITPNAAGSNIRFTHDPAKNSLYYSSGISKDNDTTFTIVLKDEAGLTYQIQACSSAKTLNAPTLWDPDTNTALSTTATPNYIELIEATESILIKAPVATTTDESVENQGMTTYYEIKDNSDSSNTISNTFTGASATVNDIGEGEYTVEIWTEKNGYLTSSHSSFTVYVKPKYTYTVKHLFQNIDNDNYSSNSSYPDQTYTAFKGTRTQAAAHSNVTGFNDGVFSPNANLTADNTIIEIKYNRKIYTLTYNTKVTELTGPAQQTYRHGKTVSVDFTTTREGYALKGWATTDTATNPTYKNQSGYKTITMTSNTTLYAVWQANRYSVTYNANGGRFQTNMTTMTLSETYDSNYSLAPAPSRTGYTFDGWYTDTNYTTEVTTSTKVQITNTQTLYAKWKLNYYSVTVTYNDCSYTESGTNYSNSKHGYGSVATFTVTPSGTKGLKTAKLTKKNGGADVSDLLTVKELGGTQVSVSFTIPDYEVNLDFTCKAAYKVKIKPYNDSASIVKLNCRYKTVRIWIADDDYSYDSQYKEVPLDNNAEYDGYICYPNNKTSLVHPRLGAITVNAVYGDDHGFSYSNSFTGQVELIMSIVQIRSKAVKVGSQFQGQIYSFRGVNDAWDYNQLAGMISDIGFKTTWKIYNYPSGPTGSSVLVYTSPLINGITYNIDPSYLINGSSANGVVGTVKICDDIMLYSNGTGTFSYP